jgi:hypothetical protein
MKKVFVIGVFLAVLGFSSVADAGLHDNGNDLVYDTDRDITWYNPNVPMMTWDQAMAWAEGLKVGGVTGWRLPTALNQDGSGPLSGYGVDGSELGHLYYQELDNPAGGPLKNTGPFANLHSIVYWSSTVWKEFAGNAWAFNFDNGKQGFASKDLSVNFSALAVHSGNIGITGVAFIVSIDVEPGSCPNPLNVKDKGVLPVAVLGSEDFDITTIAPATIRLFRAGVEGEVAPLRWSYKDVAAPFKGELCGCHAKHGDGHTCHAKHGDGHTDLTLKFDTRALVSALKLREAKGRTLALTLTGYLKKKFGGTPIKGQDCIWIPK